MGWTVLVLTPKGYTDTLGIGLLETLWRVVEAIIYTCLRASIQFHDVLHGFRSRRVTGRALMELNIMQMLASIYHDPLFLVFLYLWKSYNTMDSDRLIYTLEGYSAGTRMCILLETFWAHQ